MPDTAADPAALLPASDRSADGGADAAVSRRGDGAGAVTADLLARLQRHYLNPGQRLPGGLFLTEVGFNGASGHARADAIFVGFTSASGRVLIGHEVKASRSDWLRELDRSGKADAWADQCHEWWVVAAPGVVKRDELPVGWGLMQPSRRTRNRMSVVERAARHPERTPSWDVCRSVMARYDTLRAEQIVAAENRAHQQAQEAIDEKVRNRIEWAERTATGLSAQQLNARLEQLYSALGVRGVVDDAEQAWCRHDDVMLSRLRRIGAAANVDRNLTCLLHELAAPYRQPLDRVRTLTNELQNALDEIAEIAEIDS